MRETNAVLRVLVGDGANPDGALSDDAARACWALALSAEAYRSGQLWPTSPLALVLAEGDPTPSALLAIADERDVEEVRALHSLARHHFYPHVLSREPTRTGVTFAASDLCPADADLIAGGLLLDVKARAGRKNTAGVRGDSLEPRDLYQVIAYYLFDTHNEYDITDIGWYSARYGNLTQFNALDLLTSLSSRLGEVDVDAERQRVRQLLTDGHL